MNMEQEFFYLPKKQELYVLDYHDVDAILNAYYGPCNPDADESGDFDFEYEISWVEANESRNDSADVIELPFTDFEDEDFEEVDGWLEGDKTRSIAPVNTMLSELVHLGLLPEGKYLIEISW